MVKKKKILRMALLKKRSWSSSKGIHDKRHGGARMQDIANEAGINKALLHYYFKDKDKLFEVVFLPKPEIFPKINAIFNSDARCLKRSKFVTEYIDEMQENPFLPWFVMNEINRDPDQFMYKIWAKKICQTRKIS
jgi:AcrR family transcriptional regulator